MQVESNAVRCPDSEAAQRMYDGEHKGPCTLGRKSWHRCESCNQTIIW